MTFLQKKFALFILFLAVTVLVFTGCRNSESGSTLAEEPLVTSADINNVEKPDLGESVPPVTARIMGQVIEIISPDAKALTASYCDSLPCRARIKVVSVLGLGDDFEGQMNKNDTITVYFPTPALSTEELITDNVSDLEAYTTSGLHPGDLFQADLQVNEDASTVEESPFVVGRLVRDGE